MSHNVPVAIQYPIRINRYLALNGYCSRREADAYIQKGIVFINGKQASLGDKVEKEDDHVELLSTDKKKMKRYVYYAYNKPAGVVTHSPENGQRSIVQMLSLPNDVVPVGRLDKESRGLILLSNDGRITQRILHPDYDHEKEYIVKVDKPIENILIKVMQQGVALEDCTTKPSTVTKIDEITFRIILTEGKKHQIRRMTAALGWQVTDLKRVRILNITLSNIYPGQARKVTGEELKKFLVLLGLN